MTTYVYVATSLDGYIADTEEKLDWLPNPQEAGDCGFEEFMNSIDAIIMGKSTFEMVLSFGCEWPYTKPVLVVSNSLKEIPESLKDKVTLINGTPTKLLEKAKDKGYEKLYIDGGVNIQNFLKDDLIDEVITTVIPILLGSGKPLFGKLPKRMKFKHIETKILKNSILQHHYKRDR